MNTTGDAVAAVTAFNLTTNNMSIGHYEVYGTALATAYAGNPYGYRGYYKDSETGFAYLNARYYDPATQRFTQEDTYWGDNLQRNLYAYCSGNPVMYTDPSGHLSHSVYKINSTDFRLKIIINENDINWLKTLISVKRYINIFTGVAAGVLIGASGVVLSLGILTITATGVGTLVAAAITASAQVRYEIERAILDRMRGVEINIYMRKRTFLFLEYITFYRVPTIKVIRQ